MAETNPFARPIRIESVARDGPDKTIEASPAERVALAKRGGLPAIGRLRGQFSLRRIGRGIIRVRGEVHAEVTQTCVVSLEPFDVTLDEPVDVRFAVAAGERASGRALSISGAEAESLATGDEEPPDPAVDGQIDLGALAAEFMFLGLDPYPRKPGVEFVAPSESDERETPFAGLDDAPTKS